MSCQFNPPSLSRFRSSTVISERLRKADRAYLYLRSAVPRAAVLGFGPASASSLVLSRWLGCGHGWTLSVGFNLSDHLFQLSTSTAVSRAMVISEIVTQPPVPLPHEAGITR